MIIGSDWVKIDLGMPSIEIPSILLPFDLLMFGHGTDLLFIRFRYVFLLYCCVQAVSK